MIKALSVLRAGAPLEPVRINRREPGPAEITVDVAYAGICHSDLHMARNDWGYSTYPTVLGHEVTGFVSAVGTKVTAHTIGDRVAVGMLLGSCGTCPSCRAGQEQYCTGGGGAPADAGGFSERMVVGQDFALSLPSTLDMAAAAPLMCAGITMFSALREWDAGPGVRVAIVGLGGLGHLGVKLAVAMGAQVSVLSRSQERERDARRFGATGFHTVPDAPAGAFDLIISTVSAVTDLAPMFTLLDVNGTLVMAGAPTTPLSVPVGPLITGRRRLAGTSIGSLREAREMLDFCATHGIAAEAEIINADQMGTAFARLDAADVRYRLVLDAASL
ncbi:NAD(P)-dependent alcohol dehydrogenase [Actinoplanes sp. NPDC049265]|uniref:NAD(P)-dependent alcohol dehydrogenase n=1 Tax=Actinoplanes sp. NPDC049265 TaxID=3363902 RepID=UPI003724465E